MVKEDYLVGTYHVISPIQEVFFFMQVQELLCGAGSPSNLVPGLFPRTT